MVSKRTSGTGLPHRIFIPSHLPRKTNPSDGARPWPEETLRASGGCAYSRPHNLRGGSTLVCAACGWFYLTALGSQATRQGGGE